MELFESRLFHDAGVNAGLDVFSRVRYRYFALLNVMLEIMMIAPTADLIPAVLFKLFYNVCTAETFPDAFHSFTHYYALVFTSVKGNRSESFSPRILHADHKT